MSGAKRYAVTVGGVPVGSAASVSGLWVLLDGLFRGKDDRQAEVRFRVDDYGFAGGRTAHYALHQCLCLDLWEALAEGPQDFALWLHCVDPWRKPRKPVTR